MTPVYQSHTVTYLVEVAHDFAEHVVGVGVEHGDVSRRVRAQRSVMVRLTFLEKLLRVQHAKHIDSRQMICSLSKMKKCAKRKTQKTQKIMTDAKQAK